MEQVIVIGAGPCGLSAAVALQRAGLSPLIIEKLYRALYLFISYLLAILQHPRAAGDR